jgi:hypothetical protein
MTCQFYRTEWLQCRDQRTPAVSWGSPHVPARCSAFNACYRVLFPYIQSSFSFFFCFCSYHTFFPYCLHTFLFRERNCGYGIAVCACACACRCEQVDGFSRDSIHGYYDCTVLTRIFSISSFFFPGGTPKIIFHTTNPPPPTLWKRKLKKGAFGSAGRLLQYCQ